MFGLGVCRAEEAYALDEFEGLFECQRNRGEAKGVLLLG